VSLMIITLTVCHRHLLNCVCVGTADGKLVCFELTEGVYV